MLVATSTENQGLAGIDKADCITNPAIEEQTQQTDLAINFVGKCGLFYTDGGALSNPGPAGWGFHGYVYSPEDPKKGHGLPTLIITKNGYVPKVKESKDADAEEAVVNEPPVTVLAFIDGYGSYGQPETNNVAELTAAIKAVEFAIEQKLKSVTLFADSNYVVEGNNKYLNSWINNNWCRADGQPLRNLDLWKRWHNCVIKLNDLNIKLKVKKVRGHSGDLGNDSADIAASAACQRSLERNVMQDITISGTQGYWNKMHEFHPYFTHSQLYFNSNLQYHEPGVYYVGEHDRDDDDLIGKEIAEGAHCVLRMKQPDPMIEMLRQRVFKDANGHDSVVNMKLGNLRRKLVMRALMMYGDFGYFKVPTRRLDYKSFDDEPLMLERAPTGLAFRKIDCLVFLERLLEAHMGGDDKKATIAGYKATDITDRFFDQVTKTVKKEETVVTVMKPEFKPGVAKVEIEAEYTEGKKDKIILYFGVDLPNRNALKRIETANPKVTLITWMPSDKVYRYAVAVDTDEGHGVWSGMYTNMRVVG